ncbi:hypothetical protein Dimus_026573, partial [Dionaea muscipula]
KSLPSEIIMKKRVIRCKIFRENWMNENGLNDVMNLIKRQKWDRLFKRRELMHIDACKEFYVNLTMFHYKKHEVTRSRVRGVEIEFDSLRLASILGVPGNIGIFEYIKDVWEDSKYINTLETTRRFTNDNMITAARRVRSVEMKSFQRLVQFVVMKNVVTRFGKRDTTSYMDLTYMDHLISRRLVNLPRQGEEPKRYDFFEETFLTMCQLKRENGVWWLGTSDHRRRDDDVEEVNDDAPAGNEEEQNQECDWEAVVDEAALQGEHMEKEVEADESGSGEKFFDVENEVQESAEVSEDVPDVPAPAPVQQKEKAPVGVEPSAPTGSIPDSVFVSL